MFKTDDIIGDVVFISLRSNERFLDIGIRDNKGHFLIKGIDHLGLWVQHPGLISIISEDSSGKPLPQNQIKKENIPANFLITWDNINTLMHYPDREGYDFPSEFDIDIGFKK